MLMLGNLLVLFSLLFLGCSSNYYIVTKRCATRAEFGHLKQFTGETFRIKHVFLHNPQINDDEQINLKKILKNHKMKCRDIASLEITSKVTWGQSIINLFPGVSKHTLIINGIKNQTSKSNEL